MRMTNVRHAVPTTCATQTVQPQVMYKTCQLKSPKHSNLLKVYNILMITYRGIIFKTNVGTGLAMLSCICILWNEQHI